MSQNCSTHAEHVTRDYMYAMMLNAMNSLQFFRMNTAVKVVSFAPRSCRFFIQVLLLCALLASSLVVSAQEERWFQIEISIFANETFNSDVERWDIDPQTLQLPANARPLIEISEVLALSEWGNPHLNNPDITESAVSSLSSETVEVREPQLLGPTPYLRDNNFKLPDPARDAFIALPPSEHGFTDTNRALDRSPSYRLLFHSSWRQPVRQPSRSVPIIIDGGRLIDEKNELQGSVRFRFNPNADRVVVDANIWLTEFSFNEERIFQMIQSRDMRSNEFHYLDHPALGIVVLVKPYTRPPMPAAEPAQDLLQDSLDIPQ
jgi:hypothetical protein